MITLNVNGEAHTLDIEPDTPLLWALRDDLQLMGTKFGCGVGVCGACTVHVDGQVVRSCIVPVESVQGQVVTIEGLAEGQALHPVQQAWIDHQVPQCGYCQSGMIMTVAGLLREKANPTEADLAAALSNVCRCATYMRIRRAVASLTGA